MSTVRCRPTSPRPRSRFPGRGNPASCNVAQTCAVDIAAAQRLTRLLRAVVVPSEDGHASEYIAACDARREFISAFSGSAGTAVVTLDKAALATDGRYFNQASKELDANWTLLKTGLQDVPTWQEWAAAEAAGGKTVGVDPTVISPSLADDLAETVTKAGGQGPVALAENLVDAVWGDARPPRPSEPVFCLAAKYTGKDTQTKLADLRKELEKKKAAGFVLSNLDDIAWLFNLRGNDIAYNPVFFSYAVVTAEAATLYIDQARLMAESLTYLAENKIAIKPYTALFPDAEAMAAAAAAATETAETDGEAAEPARKFWISSTASWALQLALGGDKLVKAVRSPVGDAKAVKNAVEQEGMRQCHIRDGTALIEYFAWLEHQLLEEKASLDEVQVARKLEDVRKKQKEFVGLSFDTISSVGPKSVYPEGSS